MSATTSTATHVNTDSAENGVSTLQIPGLAADKVFGHVYVLRKVFNYFFLLWFCSCSYFLLICFSFSHLYLQIDAGVYEIVGFHMNQWFGPRHRSAAGGYHSPGILVTMRPILSPPMSFLTVFLKQNVNQSKCP